MSEEIDISTMHARLVQVVLHDRTDEHDNLVFENEWMLHPSEKSIRLPGNLFVVEDRISGNGWVFLKRAPLPHARPVKTEVDFEVVWPKCRMIEDARYETVVLPYRGGKFGRVAALQKYQRQVRAYDPRVDGLLVSNTWGDRSKDSRVNEGFILREIEAAAKLGVDVVQLDDGWQRGVSGNSTVAGGVWTGFWERDEKFWEPHPQRFPRGLEPVAEAGRRHGVRIGLWYAPDSSNDFANWRRDADRVLELHRAHGIDHFKIDGVKMYTAAAEENLHRFYDSVLTESGRRVAFDHDVTAAVRPGYFGLMQVGAVFVENRYTDWHNYWPHATLRNLWRLAHWVDPLRLRMEFLNQTRNAELYGDDPLAPAKYEADYLFATVMFASPLGWFEVSNLPAEFVEQVAPLVRVWKEHRERIYSGTIVPIGDSPDGTSWTGFATSDAEGGYLLMFRELAASSEATFDVPMREGVVTKLAGEGSVEVRDGRATVRIDRPLRFLFARVGR